MLTYFLGFKTTNEICRWIKRPSQLDYKTQVDNDTEIPQVQLQMKMVMCQSVDDEHTTKMLRLKIHKRHINIKIEDENNMAIIEKKKENALLRKDEKSSLDLGSEDENDNDNNNINIEATQEKIQKRKNFVMVCETHRTQTQHSCNNRKSSNNNHHGKHNYCEPKNFNQYE